MSGVNLNQFRGLVQGLVQQALQIAGDLTDAVTYTSISAAAYDPVAGTTSTTNAVFSFNGAISRLTSTNEEETSNRATGRVDAKVVVPTDAVLTCAYLDLPVQPNTNDTVSSTNRDTGVVTNWRVIKVIGMPANSAWKIQIRET